MVASEDIVSFVLGGGSVCCFLRQCLLMQACGWRSFSLHVGLARQELSPGVRDEDFGFWCLSLVNIGQYNQDGGSCAIAEAAEFSVFLY